MVEVANNYFNRVFTYTSLVERIDLDQNNEIILGDITTALNTGKDKAGNTLTEDEKQALRYLETNFGSFNNTAINDRVDLISVSEIESLERAGNDNSLLNFELAPASTASLTDRWNQVSTFVSTWFGRLDTNNNNRLEQGELDAAENNSILTDAEKQLAAQLSDHFSNVKNYNLSEANNDGISMSDIGIFGGQNEGNFDLLEAVVPEVDSTEAVNQDDLNDVNFYSDKSSSTSWFRKIDRDSQGGIERRELQIALREGNPLNLTPTELEATRRVLENFDTFRNAKQADNTENHPGISADDFIEVGRLGDAEKLFDDDGLRIPAAQTVQTGETVEGLDIALNTVNFYSDKSSEETWFQRVDQDDTGGITQEELNAVLAEDSGFSETDKAAARRALENFTTFTNAHDDGQEHPGISSQDFEAAGGNGDDFDELFDNDGLRIPTSQIEAPPVNSWLEDRERFQDRVDDAVAPGTTEFRFESGSTVWEAAEAIKRNNPDNPHLADKPTNELVNEIMALVTEQHGITDARDIQADWTIDLGDLLLEEAPAESAPPVDGQI